VIKKKNEEDSTFCTQIQKCLLTIEPDLIDDIILIILQLCYELVHLSKLHDPSSTVHAPIAAATVGGVPICGLFDMYHIPIPLRCLVEGIVVSSDVRGGGTADEFACNILFSGEEVWNKWYFVEYQGHILFEFEKPVQIYKYMFKSANDCKERDPKSWQVFGLSEAEYAKYWNGESRIRAMLLDTRENHEFQRRWQTVEFGIPLDETAYISSLPFVKCVLIVINDFWRIGGSSGIQLGQIGFFSMV